MINEFARRLQLRLGKTLPGIDAQRLMMPAESTRARFELDREDARLGGVLVLFYPKDDEVYLPLTQRHDYGGTHSGQVSFPGGKWESGDPDLEYTALRETHEEIGVDQSDVRVIGKLTDLYIPPSNFRVSPVVAYTEERPTFRVDPYEVKELIEVPLSLLIDQSTLKKKHIAVRDTYHLNAPYFDLDGKVVWGATAMMLSELVAVIREIESDL